MEKEIFLSFRPEYFRPILYDIKKYEYRKRFCKEEVKAYLYLSSPVKEVIGIMYLGKPILIEKYRNFYKNKKTIYNRIDSEIKNRTKYAIPIKSFCLYEKPITIEEIKNIDEKFHVPQCYLNLENYKKVHVYLNSKNLYKAEFNNNHETIYEDNFCMSCLKMEQSNEFIKKNISYKNDEKYKYIKCGYLNNKN